MKLIASAFGGLLAIVAIVAIVAAIAFSGGGKHETPAARAQQRAELALVAKQLLALEHGIQHEVQRARIAWRSLHAGLPESPSERLAAEVKQGALAAEAVPSPRFLMQIQQLSGPAVRIGRLFFSYRLLTKRAYSHIEAAIAAIRHGSATARSFAKANTNVYVASLYDAHFDLSVIGEKILHTYERLGEEAAFGSMLSSEEVRSLVAAYSPEAVLLKPHTWASLRPKP